MKTNEAPEKIWIDPATDLPKLSGHIDKDSVEYTRTDAFIKKACDAYCKVCKMPNCRRNECKWISDFKEHLQTIRKESSNMNVLPEILILALLFGMLLGFITKT